jgi:hypothetical protein
VQRESEPHEAVARAHVLRLHAKRYEALTSARILPPNWRLDTLYDLSRCPHTTQAIVNVKNDHGSCDLRGLRGQHRAPLSSRAELLE